MINYGCLGHVCQGVQGSARNQRMLSNGGQLRDVVRLSWNQWEIVWNPNREHQKRAFTAQSLNGQKEVWFLESGPFVWRGLPDSRSGLWVHEAANLQ